MLTLALDTTTRAGSVAVVSDDQVLAVRTGDAERTHGERLPAEIDGALAAAGASRFQIDLLVVASGPGAFTGLRIGLAAMQGIALTLGRPIVGVSGLDALAWTALGSDAIRAAGPDARLATWMDAQRGEVFSAVYRAGTIATTWPLDIEAEPAVGTPAALFGKGAFDRRRPTVFAGDGARRYAGAIAAESVLWSVTSVDLPLAPALARIGRRLLAQGHPTAPHAIQPLYVRRPDAEIERDRLAGTPVDAPEHPPDGGRPAS